MVITMFLSDIRNNAATVIIMSPIAYNLAIELSKPCISYTVAVGASCAFLTPIGHQCNTLVMGPGNYKLETIGIGFTTRNINSNCFHTLNYIFLDIVLLIQTA